jgi:hypothetical protein
MSCARFLAISPPIWCLVLGIPVVGETKPSAPLASAAKEVEVPVAASVPWRFGEPLQLEKPDVLWSHLSLNDVPTFNVREGYPAYRWDTTAPWPGRFVPDVSEKTILDSPREVADFLRDMEAPSFWDAVKFWQPTVQPLSRSPEVRRFFCTVYYTPKESGFTADGGFDMTLETRRGLGGRKFARSFLKAVTVEGFGRLKEPVDGKGYIKYDGRWGYSTRILGNRNNTLVPRHSAAVNRRNPLFTKGTQITILDPSVFDALGTIDWRVADTGGGLHWWQIDLYWDEDDPLGPGIDVYRPKHCPMAVSRWIPVAIEKK